MNNNHVENVTYANRTDDCEMANTINPGVIALAFGNITSISVLRTYNKSLAKATLINIYLNSNKIHILAPSQTWLPHYPSTNLSKTLHIKTLMLNNNGLSNILPGAWLNLVFDRIYMYNNNLMNISYHTFVNLDTILLALNNNKIRYITKIGLRHIKHIKSLILVNNMIHQLEFIQFPLTLKQLYVNNNNLSNVDFKYDYIMETDFSLNHITFLQRMTHRYLVISVLKFHNNMINYIDENAFQSYKSIDNLDLSNNFFDLNFTKIYFDKYFQCGFLNLSNNHISSVRNLFYHASFRRILELDLSHNYIMEVSELNKHDHHIILKKLHLSYNKITYLSPNILQHMVQLIYVNFKANMLRFIYFMPAISPDVALDFAQNLLHCSCHLRWLKERALLHKYKIAFCKDLVSLRQVRIIDVPLEDFVCETPCTTDQCDCYGPHVNDSSLTTHVTCSGQGLTEVPHFLMATCLPSIALRQ